MDFKLLVHLIFLCVLNIIFFFSGLVLNTLVIIAFLKSTKLQKKLCHFMIMVLSCCDLLSVVIHGLELLFYFIIRFLEKNGLYTKLTICWHLLHLLAGLSLLALMVMCIERYLGAYYPIFHKTSVTRCRLLTLLATLFILTSPLTIISANDLVISSAVAIGIFVAIFSPPFIFFNYKLFKISRKMHRENATSSKKREKISLKNINTCLLVVACFVCFSVPICFRVVFGLVEGSTPENARLSAVWVATTYVMNCSFNSLIFFWKNKVLRDEGIKIIKKMKDRVLCS